MILLTRGGVPAPGGAWSRGGWWRHPPGTATAAGGTHPTGMHSCYQWFHGRHGMTFGTSKLILNIYNEKGNFQ